MRPTKTRFSKSRRHSEEESVKINYSKNANEIVKEILTSLNVPELSNAKKLSYYNTFVKFFYREGQVECSFSKEEVVTCLQAGLFSKWKELRIGALRALRYYCTDAEVVLVLFRLHLHYLVVRSLDICLNNDVERTNALRLIRRIVTLLLPPPTSPPCFKCHSPSSLCPSSPSPSSSPPTVNLVCPSSSANPPSLSSPAATISSVDLFPSLSSTTITTSIKKDLIWHSLATSTATTLHQSTTTTATTKDTSTTTTTDSITQLPTSTHSHYNDITTNLRSLQLVSHTSTDSNLSSFTSLLNGVIAIANDGFLHKDKLFNVCLSTICELAILEPFLAAEIGGISCLLQNVHQFYGHPRINEALVSTILNIFNFSHTRSLIKINLDLEQMLVPFTDLEFKESLELKERFDAGSDVKYGACKLALGTILRSWSGIFYICNQSSQGLKSLFSILSLSKMETRKEILDVFYDIFRFSVPEWTDDFNTALKSIAALSKTMDSWKLVNGFIAEEAKSILPHLTSTRLNLIDNHMAFILCCFINHGLLEAVTKAVISSDKNVCVRATVLLGELLYLTSIFLPASYNENNHCLPNLLHCVMISMETKPSLRIQCSDALNCLLQIQSSKKVSPLEGASCFLQHQIVCCQNAAKTHRHPQFKEVPLSSAADWSHWPSNRRRGKKDSSSERESSESLSQLLQDSQVLYTTNSKSWNWFTVLTILKFPEDSLELTEEIMAQRFLERLVQVFKPSSKIYSMMKLSNDKCHEMTLIAFHLIDYLLSSPEQVANTLLYNFLQDVNVHLVKVVEKASIVDSSLNPSSLINTCSQMYFLFIGKLSSTNRGNLLLRSSKIFDSFSRIASSSLSSDIIIKLMISSLDYSNSLDARKILKEALVSSSEKPCQFCTSFLRILLRCHFPLFTKWCIPLLINQLKNQSMAVATEALSVLTEAAETEEHLRFIAEQRYNLKNIGFKSDSLTSRFLSLPDLFQQLKVEGLVEREMEKWRVYNIEFVAVVEERLVESMTTYEKTYDHNYARRTSRKYVRKDVLVPIHLYGQLVQHKEGVETLKSQLCLDEYFELVRKADSCAKENLKFVKAALWIVGHIGSTELGLNMLLDRNIISHVVRAAETNPILTLRGTAFYILSMLAATDLGSDELKKYGWTSVRMDKVDPLYCKSIHNETSEVEQSKNDTKSFATVDLLPEIVENTIEVTTLQIEKEISNNNNNNNTNEPYDQSKSSVTVSIASSTSGDQLNSLGKDRKPSVNMFGLLLQKLKHKHLKASTESLSKQPQDTEFSKKSETFHNSLDRKRDKNRNPSSNTCPEAKGKNENDDNNFNNNTETLTGDGRFERRVSDAAATFTGKPENAATKVTHRSAQSSSSSTGKMSTSIGSDDVYNFSNNSIFVSNQSSDERVDRKPATGDFHSIQFLPLKVEKSVTDPVGSSSGSSNGKNVSGFLSDPDILRPKHRKPPAISEHIWLTVGDVSERHNKTKSLDQRNPFKNSNFRHSIKDKMKTFKVTMKSYSESETKISYKRNQFDPLGNPITKVIPSELKLRRMPSHFISISLPENMEQVFQSIETENKERSPPFSKKNVSHSLRKDFFRHPVYHDGTSNKEVFDKLFDGLEEHKAERCLLCSHHVIPPTSASIGEKENERLCGESPTQPMCEDSVLGKVLIRKEVLRLLLQLSCSVGAKSTEQGLLILKQRFPKSFQSLCLYSEVSYMLASCPFRLESRHFVQELFLDLDFRECHHAARKILNLPDTSTVPPLPNIQLLNASTIDDDKMAFSDFDFTSDKDL